MHGSQSKYLEGVMEPQTHWICGEPAPGCQTVSLLVHPDQQTEFQVNNHMNNNRVQ